jgi:hypothetical protein
MIAPQPWTWDEATGPARVMGELSRAGYSLIHWPAAAAAYREDAWAFGQALLGVPLTRIQVMPVKFSAGVASYTSSNVEALLHTDAGGLWIPAHIQVMVSVRAAESGGESLLLDSWQVLDELERTDPDLFARCFDTPLPMGFRQPWWGPAVSWRSGNLIFTQPPEPDDHAVAVRLRTLVDRARPVTFLCQPGDVLVFNNHRVMHGRKEFADPRRELLKLHAWLTEPFDAPPAYQARAAAEASRLAGQFSSQPAHIRQYLGFDAVTSATANERLGAVLRALGASGDLARLSRVARQTGIDTEELLQWLDTVLLAGLRALASQPVGFDLEEAVEAAFEDQVLA